MNGLIVFMGGGIGALVRYFLYLIFPSKTYLPFGTSVANFFGCFIATVVFTYFTSKSNLDPSYKTFLITGFCGGLSTLSALSLELMVFVQSGEYLRALFYIMTTVIVCMTSVLLGIIIVKHWC